MARVHNWQIGRDMAYWYPEHRPQKQFAAVFDLNKCIACQTCTLACKTTWTSGAGQEYMLWNNVESKPWGFYPLQWDLKILEKLGPQPWNGSVYEGRTIFEAAPVGERFLGWLPQDIDYSYPNVGEDDCTSRIDAGVHFSGTHGSWFFYLPRICNHCTYPACLASCPRGSIYKRPEDGIVLLDQKRCRGYRECVQACPYKKTYYNPLNGTSEKCIGCYPKVQQQLQPQCVLNCIGKIRLQGFLSRSEAAIADNPIDYLVHIKKIALPLFPQFGLEPNVYYIPPTHVPSAYLQQLFGPGVDAAISSYRNAPNDPDLAALLCLFGCSEQHFHSWKRQGNSAVAFDKQSKEITRIPITEPVFVREAFDPKYRVARMNTP
jgi:nitrate reductase beta subunit